MLSGLGTLPRTSKKLRQPSYRSVCWYEQRSVAVQEPTSAWRRPRRAAAVRRCAVAHMNESAAERGRAGAHVSWARTPDRAARTLPARSAFLARFEREVDPLSELSPAERATRAEHALKAHMARMRLAKARKARKAAKRTGPQPAP